MLDVTPLNPGESYATISHIRDVADLPEMPVEIPDWNDNGKRCIILLRALSFGERRSVQRESKDDVFQEALLICLYGIKEPRLTKEHLSMLESKKPGAIDAIADTIVTLGGYDAEKVRAFVHDLANVPQEDTRADMGSAAT